ARTATRSSSRHRSRFRRRRRRCARIPASSSPGSSSSTSGLSLRTARPSAPRLPPMNRKVAILGAGKIGESLLAGLLSSEWRTRDEIVVTGRREERVHELEERHGVRGTLSNAEAVRGASLVVIAVKPQDFDALLGDVGGLLTEEQTVLSVAAAI